MGQESADIVLTKLLWVSLAVKQNVPANPLDVSLLGAN
jgi:hypothetical protein